MKFRNMIFVMAIAFSVIFASMIGTSYAYYVATGGTTIDVTTGNVDTGIAVVFAQSQYINLYTGIPIKEDEVDDWASASVFTLTPNATILGDAEVAVNVGIVDLSIDEALVVSDFKYKFTCNDGSSDVVNISGTGEDFSEDVINANYFEIGTLSTINGTFNASKTYTCTLRLWLHETGENQNKLMNKKFRGLIKVNTLFKK